MTTQAQPLVNFPQFDKLREFLNLLAALASIGDPITTDGGLRKALQIVLQLGKFLGLGTNFIERVQKILSDDRVFQIVLSIVQYVTGLLRTTTGPKDSRIRFEAVDNTFGAYVEAQDFLEWLPLVLQILELLQRVQDMFQMRCLSVR